MLQLGDKIDRGDLPKFVHWETFQPLTSADLPTIQPRVMWCKYHLLTQFIGTFTNDEVAERVNRMGIYRT